MGYIKIGKGWIFEIKTDWIVFPFSISFIKGTALTFHLLFLHFQLCLNKKRG